MSKEDKIKELQATAQGVKNARNEAIKAIYQNEMIGLIKNITKFEIKLNWFGVDCCDIEFAEKPNVSLHIRYNSDKMIEISHGLYSNFALVRKQLIECDKIVARLWDKETELTSIFLRVKEKDNKYLDALCELNDNIHFLENDIKQEKYERALSQLAVGSKWCFEWDKERRNSFTIEKITEKLIFIKQSLVYGSLRPRYKISEMVSWFNNNTIIKLEGEDDNK